MQLLFPKMKNYLKTKSSGLKEIQWQIFIKEAFQGFGFVNLKAYQLLMG